MCLIHSWICYVWKDKKHYGGHRCVRVCQKCGLKQEYHDPNNMITTSSEQWIDANTGKIWQPTDLTIPTDQKKYNSYKGSMPRKIIYKGLVD